MNFSKTKLKNNIEETEDEINRIIDEIRCLQEELTVNERTLKYYKSKFKSFRGGI
jgi:septal ring factor EnvC (AmiA/AmiB activator)